MYKALQKIFLSERLITYNCMFKDMPHFKKCKDLNCIQKNYELDKKVKFKYELYSKKTYY